MYVSLRSEGCFMRMRRLVVCSTLVAAGLVVGWQGDPGAADLNIAYDEIVKFVVRGTPPPIGSFDTDMRITMVTNESTTCRTTPRRFSNVRSTNASRSISPKRLITSRIPTATQTPAKQSGILAHGYASTNSIAIQKTMGSCRNASFDVARTAYFSDYPIAHAYCPLHKSVRHPETVTEMMPLRAARALSTHDDGRQRRERPGHAGRRRVMFEIPADYKKAP